MSFLQKIINWLFGKKPAAPAKVQRKKKRTSKEHYGSHYYLGDLLDQLDAVFQDLPKFKKSDPEAYKLYSKIGATVRSSDAVLTTYLEPYIARELPTFGCMYMGCEPNDVDFAPMRFAYILKETRPINVQTTNATVYRCGLTFSLDDRVVATSFYVAVTGGSIKPLKVCRPTQHVVGKGTKQSFFYRMEWKWPAALAELATKVDRDIEEYAGELFSVIANAAYERERGITVSVNRRGKKAVFSIDMLRAPYFFSDREKVTNENGRTKKIFHYVRGHERTFADAKKKFVKGHWRGLRRFSWNGYDVRIGMPGLNDKSLSDINFASLDPTYEGDDVVTADELASRIDHVLT